MLQHERQHERHLLGMLAVVLKSKLLRPHTASHTTRSWLVLIPRMSPAYPSANLMLTVTVIVTLNLTLTGLAYSCEGA